MSHIVNQSVRIEYQPARGTAGLIVGAEIFDETGEQDLINFPNILLAEIPLVESSMYRGEFIPDEIGTWTIHIADSAGGTAIKQYIVVKDIEKMNISPAMIG